MRIGIVGLPASGKTAIFNAVTRGKAEVAAYGAPQGKPNIGVAKVPDPRLDVLEGVFKPKRKVPAEVTYVDAPPSPEGFGATPGISGEFRNDLQSTEALLVVARAFEDPSVPVVGDGVDPFRAVETMAYELTFADLEVLERRMERIAQGLKGARAAERDTWNRERALMTRVKVSLEEGTAIRDQRFEGDEARLLEGFQFLTAKPLIVVVNVGEDQLSDLSSLETRLASEVSGHRVRATALCGELEMDLAQMDPAEECEFRRSLGLGESGLDRMIGLSYDVLDLVTFYTGNANEVRAWGVARGTTAVRAAGTVHSDFERGFIRAEVVGFDDLARCGSIAEARRQGLLRQEGKSYEVKDGDVINVLFNV